MVDELLAEIMQAIGVQAFNFDLGATIARLHDFIQREKYFVFVARDSEHRPAGFIALYESYALYAEGAFGTIPELYVRPAQRVHSSAKSMGRVLPGVARSLVISSQVISSTNLNATFLILDSSWLITEYRSIALK